MFQKLLNRVLYKNQIEPKSLDKLPDISNQLSFTGISWSDVCDIDTAFQNNPSGANFDRLSEGLQAFLQNHPSDWQALHRQLGLSTVSGLVSQARETQEAIFKLKRSLQKQYDLGDLGFTVLPLTYAAAVGNMAILDIVAKAQHLGLLKNDRVILPAPSAIPANEAFLDVLSQRIRVIRSEAGVAAIKDFVGYGEIGGALDIEGRIRLFWEASHLIQLQWEEQKRAPLFTLPVEMQERCVNFLRSNGVQEGEWFVCLHVRTSGRYQDDWSLRNASIESYWPAIQEITKQGGWVIRMGDPSMPKMDPCDRVIDYAHHPSRLDALDIALCQGCRFFFGTASGMGHVATLFGVPGLFTNWMPWGIMPWSTRDMVMPKLLREKTTQRILNVQESLSDPIGFIQDERFLSHHGIECMDNSSEDLASAVREFILSLETLPPQSAQQRQFAELEKRIGICQSNCRLSQTFANAHPELWKGIAS